MTERFEKLEAELAGMKPRALSGEVVEEIFDSLPTPNVWADRLLVGAMSIGSLAACVIVGVLVLQSSPASTTPPPASVANAPRMGDVSVMLARADSPWVEHLK